MKKKNFSSTFEFDFHEQPFLSLHRLTDELVDYLFGISFSEMLVKTFTLFGKYCHFIFEKKHENTICSFK
jgi:hypothetical protein